MPRRRVGETFITLVPKSGNPTLGEERLLFCLEHFVEHATAHIFFYFRRFNIRATDVLRFVELSPISPILTAEQLFQDNDESLDDVRASLAEALRARPRCARLHDGLACLFQLVLNFPNNPFSAAEIAARPELIPRVSTSLFPHPSFDASGFDFITKHSPFLNSLTTADLTHEAALILSILPPMRLPTVPRGYAYVRVDNGNEFDSEFLLTQRAPGETLRDWLKRAPDASQDRARLEDLSAILMQVFLTLAVMHERAGVIHGDVNGGNVIVEELPEPRRIHFDVGGRRFTVTSRHLVHLIDFEHSAFLARCDTGLSDTFSESFPAHDRYLRRKAVSDRQVEVDCNFNALPKSSFADVIKIIVDSMKVDFLGRGKFSETLLTFLNPLIPRHMKNLSAVALIAFGPPAPTDGHDLDLVSYVEALIGSGGVSACVEGDGPPEIPPLLDEVDTWNGGSECEDPLLRVSRTLASLTPLQCSVKTASTSANAATSAHAAPGA